MAPLTEIQGKPRIVIVGAGFGGLAAAKALAKTAAEILLIDKRNYHLFQPLLYQVATAALSPADIAWPIRGIVGRQRNTTVLLGHVDGIDTQEWEVQVDGRRITYDYLVIATGARHAYFGHDDWEDYAPGLKKIEDATTIRRQILVAFERAESESDPVEQQRLLRFVVVGGGPTGVELAGAIAELAKKALAADFRNIDPRAAEVILVEAAPRLLTAFPDPLSAKAKLALEQLGVQVLLGQPVSDCDCGGVTVGDHRIEARNMVWAAGVAASPAAKWLGAEHDRADRVKVLPDLSVPGLANVFVIGDTALALDDNGKPYPGVAPVAKQQGIYVARLLSARIAGRRTNKPFRYRSYGNLATIGRNQAVADFGGFRLSGFSAWLLWSLAHVYFLIGLRNRLSVAIQWSWSYLNFQRGARLITGDVAGVHQAGDATTVEPLPEKSAENL